MNCRSHFNLRRHAGILYFICLAIQATLAARAHASMSVEGEQCFVDEANLALAAISNTSEDLYNFIQNYIKTNDQVEVHIVYAAGVAMASRTGSHKGLNGLPVTEVTIYWDPDGQAGVRPWSYKGKVPEERYDDGTCVDMTGALAHELQHALDGSIGFPKTDTNSGIKDSEIAAIGRENDYRVAHGICPRTTYGSNVIPKIPAASGDCKTAPAT